jgi:serine beta-lactamase-like protein LACTB, mitochondrial
MILVCWCALTATLLAQDLERAKGASRTAMQQMIARGSTPGASVAVAVDGKIVWSEGFGYADLEWKVPATRQSKFALGSVTKPLTAALFARLAEKGLVDWDAPVEKYVPEFRHQGRGVTPRMIAGHLGGTHDEFDTASRLTAKTYTTAQAFDEVTKESLKSKPGTKFAYATGSYTVLAMIIERVTGKPFVEVIETELLKPLGMNDTVPNDRHAVIPNRVSLYEMNDARQFLNAPYFDPSYKRAGAGYLATAEDVAKFGAAFMSGKVAGPEQMQILTSPVRVVSGEQPTTGTGAILKMKDNGVGLGWSLATDSLGRGVVHQPGGGPGISTWLVLYPKEKVAIAILSNYSSAPVGGNVMRTIIENFIPAQRINRGSSSYPR